MTYAEFLQSKGHRVDPAGFEAGPAHPMLYAFQAGLVRWALKLGRAAIFADCGLGKSFMQIEWARQIQQLTGGVVLIVAPLAVAPQTITEAAKLGVEVVRVSGPGSEAPIQITNYDRLHHFVGSVGNYAGIVLDESSILKSLDGKTRSLLLGSFTGIPYRLCCTATPAPNDVSELANHAEFIGAMSRPEMLATFFVHDMDDGEWRLKGHAAQEMWRWMARWAVFVRRPSDLGHVDGGWVLPTLSITDEVVHTGLTVDLGGISKRSAVRRQTLDARVARTAEIIANAPGQWLVWCGLNDEETAIAAALGSDCVVINGQTDEDDRITLERAWREGRVRTLITKPKVFGFGMNWQHCHQTVFLGIGDSYEQYYQAVRRVYRFGQVHSVDVRIVVSDVEGAIAENVKRKEQEAQHMAEQIVAAVKDNQVSQRAEREDVYKTHMSRGSEWNLFLGDCVERIKLLKAGVVGFSIYSPPFASLYTYSSSRRDLGNCRDFDEFFAHYSYLIPEILRVTMPGRRTAVHCQQLSTSKATHGVIGWRDFRGELIKAYVAAGWIYDGEICIDKNPQAQAIRTKSKQLMFVQKEKDSSWLRPAMADYILLFRAPGENPVPVKTDVTNEEWILFAHPIWYGIRESNVLGYKAAREDEDEKHICPLQLETIERCIRLWSNPGEVVFSPFAGIGSEGYVARRFGRRFVGIELKEAYWKQATKHLEIADSEGLMQPTEAIGKPLPKPVCSAGQMPDSSGAPA